MRSPGGLEVVALALASPPMPGRVVGRTLASARSVAIGGHPGRSPVVITEVIDRLRHRVVSKRSPGRGELVAALVMLAGSR